MSEPILTTIPAARPGFIRRYVFSLDHKVIGLQYILLAIVAATLGVILSLFMRFNLSWPQTSIPLLGTIFPKGAPNGLMNGEFYLSLMTMHATLMVFFVLTTAPQGGFGNYFLPLQIGARDMAFPRLNMLSFWSTFAALVVLLGAVLVEGSEQLGTSSIVSRLLLPGGSGVIGPIGGWTSYATLSALGTAAGPGEGAGMSLWICSIALFCAGSLMGALNFIVTILNLRAPGMSLLRMPLPCWGWFTTAILALLAFPVLLAAALLLFLDRTAGTSFFLPGGLYVGGKALSNSGGSPILWQHLFWFFGHPEVYIAILPGMGVTSHILSTFSRKPVFGYRFMVIAFFAIGLLGFFVWGHHMFISGMDPRSAMAFSVLTLSIGVPSAIKTFNWLGTIWGGKIQLTVPMLFALGFVSVFVAGGLTGIILGQTILDLPLTDTYFVVAHFHLVMGVAAVFGIFGATYFWFPKMFGRLMNETLGKTHFFVTFVGVYATFVPMHVIGIMGIPRRYARFTEFAFASRGSSLVTFVTIAALVTGFAQLLFLFNFFWSIFRGRPADSNPWRATSLEWLQSARPGEESFGGGVPQVRRGPYEFSVPGEECDFLMQGENSSAHAGHS